MAPLHIVNHYWYSIPHTVTKELSFGLAICYLSDKWVNILHAWTVNWSKNAKVITAHPLNHPTFHLLTHLYHKHVASRSVKNAKIIVLICVTNASFKCRWVNFRLGWKVTLWLLECVCKCLTNLFTKSTVHACNMLTHLKLSTRLIEMTIPLLHCAVHCLSHLPLIMLCIPI